MITPISQGPSHVHSRIADIRSRLAALQVGPPVGGRVGSGSQSISGPSGTTPAGATEAASSSTTTPTVAPPVSGVTTGPPAGAVPGTGTTSTAAPDWADRLPAAGTAWADEITTAAEANGVRPELLAALVWSESAFDPNALSPAGARGLGQLMPGTAAELGVDPDDPIENLDGAARYLRQQLDRFGSTDLALAAYNAGPGRVMDAGGVPNISETRTYVARVSERARHLGGTA